MTCDHFGRDQICTQVNASFLPFGHSTQVSSQVQLAAPCDYLRVRLTRALVRWVDSNSDVSIFAWKELKPTTTWLLCVMLYHIAMGGTQWKRLVNALCIHRGVNKWFFFIEAPIQLGPDDELYCGRTKMKMLFKRHCSCSSFFTAQRTCDRKNLKKTKQSGLGKCFNGGKVARRVAGRLLEVKSPSQSRR